MKSLKNAARQEKQKGQTPFSTFALDRAELSTAQGTNAYNILPGSIGDQRTLV